jgi:hypothetical protein
MQVLLRERREKRRNQRQKRAYWWASMPRTCRRLSLRNGSSRKSFFDMSSPPASSGGVPAVQAGPRALQLDAGRVTLPVHVRTSRQAPYGEVPAPAGAPAGGSASELRSSAAGTLQMFSRCIVPMTQAKYPTRHEKGLGYFSCAESVPTLEQVLDWRTRTRDHLLGGGEVREHCKALWAAELCDRTGRAYLAVRDRRMDLGEGRAVQAPRPPELTWPRNTLQPAQCHFRMNGNIQRCLFAIIQFDFLCSARTVARLRAVTGQEPQCTSAINFLV